ncbi:MAG: AAA family ATPase [Methyloligellaceae bacterium]
MIYYDFPPGEAGGGIDWLQIEQSIPWFQDMAECMQDAVFHAEGDVWTHTRMVVEALCADERYRALSEVRRRILFWAAVLHDIAKPKTRDAYFDKSLGRDRVSHPNHSRLGERMARPFLWKLGVPMVEREQICSIIRYHQRIFHILRKRKSLKGAIEISQKCIGSDLYLHAVADYRGRICAEPNDTLVQLECVYEYFAENDIHDKPWHFGNGLSRYEYFSHSDRNPHYTAYEEQTDFEVVLLSGLPGAGKDHLIEQHYSDYAVVSLDDIRKETGASPTGNQGAVIRLAFERSKEHLRAKRKFVWNATNLSLDMRSKPLQLFKEYGARTKIHYLEVEHDLLFAQNKKRDKAVPEKVIQQMLNKWQVPDPWEADHVIWQNGDEVVVEPVGFIG